MSKGLGIAAAVGMAVGYAARQANVFEGVVREGGVVDLGRLGDNLRGAAEKVRETVSGLCPAEGAPAEPPGESEARPAASAGASDDDGA